jgi:hypothetical protein
MSFDVFFQSFDAKRNPEKFSFALIEREFGPFATTKDAKWWDLDYPDGGHCEVYVDATGSSISSFMVARPPASEEFWLSLFKLLQQTPSCLYWPGGGPVIAQPFVRDRLPLQMIEGLGEPVVISTPEQIVAAIRNS